jgi:pimeloyl-ACP methyl ester carboxylesterase
MRRLRIGDRMVRVRDEGAPVRTAHGPTGKRPPVVCVHGAASSSVVWIDVVRRLSSSPTGGTRSRGRAARWRVVALDLPGHGQSDRWHPPSDVSIDMYRDALGTVCAQLEIERAVLVGHSMGALIALAAAAAWPERVAGLVLVNAAAKIRTSPSLAVKLPSLCWSPTTPRDVVERWNAVAFTADDEIAAADLGAVDRYDATPLLARIKAPTLILSGADDLVTPPTLAADLARGLGAATARIVPQAAHMVMLEQPDTFVAELESFLQS